MVLRSNNLKLLQLLSSVNKRMCTIDWSCQQKSPNFKYFSWSSALEHTQCTRDWAQVGKRWSPAAGAGRLESQAGRGPLLSPGARDPGAGSVSPGVQAPEGSVLGEWKGDRQACETLAHRLFYLTLHQHSHRPARIRERVREDCSCIPSCCPSSDAWDSLPEDQLSKC